MKFSLDSVIAFWCIEALYMAFLPSTTWGEGEMNATLPSNGTAVGSKRSGPDNNYLPLKAYEGQFKFTVVLICNKKFEKVGCLLSPNWVITTNPSVIIPSQCLVVGGRSNYIDYYEKFRKTAPWEEDVSKDFGVVERRIDEMFIMPNCRATDSYSGCLFTLLYVKKPFFDADEVGSRMPIVSLKLSRDLILQDTKCTVIGFNFPSEKERFQLGHVATTAKGYPYDCYGTKAPNFVCVNVPMNVRDSGSLLVCNGKLSAVYHFQTEVGTWKPHFAKVSSVYDWITDTMRNSSQKNCAAFIAVALLIALLRLSS